MSHSNIKYAMNGMTFVCLRVCARERDSVYACVIVSVGVNVWVGMNVFFTICMHVEVKM